MRVRDAVVGDIMLDEWEVTCVRSPVFQRLHRIKQLGNAFHVYPSAMHTRFEHSLGVCHQIKKLLSQPGFLPEGYEPDEGTKRIAQLAGLLHDVVHTPFKHTLERDAAILQKESLRDEYQSRIEQMDLKTILGLGNDQLHLLIKLLSTENPYDLEEPYLRQVIEDTLSADLLDYSRRDFYFTIGASRVWDERVYDHIAVADYDTKRCLVARITDETGKVTQSAMTELTNLLQIRYVLNERVYLYPTKIAADSLLVKSVRNLLMSDVVDEKKFKDTTRDMSDEELVNYLIIETGAPDVAYYAQRLKDRGIPAVAHSFSPIDLTEAKKQRIQDSCRGHDRFDQWLGCEQEIAKSAKVDPRDIIVYCHDPDMQKKSPDFLVKGEDQKPQPLRSSAHMTNWIKAIAENHERLWRCYVFCLDRSDESLARVRQASDEILRAL